VFELTGDPDEIDRFVNLMTECGLVEVARTGLAALSRGKTGI
jgi:acetolactate synthase I/III small subunit